MTINFSLVKHGEAVIMGSDSLIHSITNKIRFQDKFVIMQDRNVCINISGVAGTGDFDIIEILEKELISKLTTSDDSFRIANKLLQYYTRLLHSIRSKVDPAILLNPRFNFTLKFDVGPCKLNHHLLSVDSKSLNGQIYQSISVKHFTTIVMAFNSGINIKFARRTIQDYKYGDDIDIILSPKQRNLSEMTKSSMKTNFAMIMVISLLLGGTIGSITKNNEQAEKDRDDLQEQSLEALRDSGNNPVISEEVRGNVEKTLTGFAGGFLENMGQKNEAIHYYTESTQMAVGFGMSEVRFSISLPRPNPRNRNAQLIEAGFEEKVTYTTMSLEFLGSNEVVPIAKKPTGAYSHFFIGSDERKWSTSQYYTKVVYQNLYQNIDLVYELKNSQLKYEFFVYPGGNLNDIRLHWIGPVSLELVDSNIKVNIQLDEKIDSELSAKISFVDTRPINYQSLNRENPIQGSFKVLDATTYGFDIPTYDPKKLLVIDPVILTYSTYMSGSRDDEGYGITVDDAGNAYVMGTTHSTDFPDVNAYDPTGDGDFNYHDVFVFKLAANGSSLLYSTYISGSSFDHGYDIAVDDAGNAYVTGITFSTDFPTVNAYNATHSGGYDGFISKLAANGSSLLYSTYIGGSNHDYSMAIALNGADNVYITGYTYSTDFPTVNAYNATHGGGYDGFISKLAANGSSLLYSTYVGGSKDDYGYGIAVDDIKNAYVTGRTHSTDFPTVNAYNVTGDENTTYADVFVCKLAANGSSLLYSTYVSGNHSDIGRDIALDTVGNAYITGSTSSTDFPTLNAYNATGDGTAYGDAFVFKLAANGSSLLYSTYISGSQDDDGYGIAVDGAKNAYVTGFTRSTDFPTVNAYDAGGDRDTSVRDVFACKLAANGSSLLYSTYVSGFYDDYGRDIALDTAGNIYVTGYTRSTNFPIMNPYDATGDGVIGFYDSFVFKLSFYSPPRAPQSLSATAGELFVYLSWTTPSSGGGSPIIGYRVYRGTSSGTYTLIFVASGANYNDTLVSGGTTYYYVVTALNTIGESSFSNEVGATPIVSPITTSSAPQSLIATAGELFVYLSWTTPSNDGGSPITGYRVYRGTSSGTYTVFFLASGTNYNDTLVVGGTTYYYVVTAINTIGESIFSTEVSTTPTKPTTPTTTPTTTTTTITGTTPAIDWMIAIFLLTTISIVLAFKKKKLI